jgi:DNA-binding transcriptional LysR family regulator
VRIAESGTFSKAADSMNIPRPTVTKLVQDLEHHLATKLLHRTTRRVSVTPEGAAYYERATRLIADLDWVTCASPLYLGARGVPKHPSELLPREPESKQDTGVPGHAIAGYFSSLTGRAFPLEFRKGDEQILVQGQVVVAVNESTAHLSALLAGVGLGQAFKFMVSPHLQSGRLRTVLDDWRRPRQPLHVLYPSNRHLSAKTRLFVDWVAEVFAPFDDR